MTDTSPPPANVYVGTPCFGGMVATGYMMSVLKLMQYAGGAGFSLSVNLLGRDSLVTRARNTIVAQFLETDSTHLMFIDADLTFEPQLVHRMLAFDEDIVAGMYPAKAFQWDPPAKLLEREPRQTAMLQYVGKFCEPPELERRGPFATGVYCATGFMLIRRSVIEHLIAANPDRAYTSDHVYVENKQHRQYHALFECMIDPETKEYLSEDFGFCRLWRALGGKIWLDVEGALTHTGPYDFVGAPDLRFGKSAE